jgi:Flp pilus assembly protein TadG
VSRRPESGSTSLELVLLAPVLLAVMMLVAAFGRHSNVQGYVDQAARDAARTATAQRVDPTGATSARLAVQSTIDAALLSAPQRCQETEEHEVTAVQGNGARTTYQPSSPYHGDEVVLIQVQVSCEVDTSDLSFIGFGTSLRFTSTFTSPMPAVFGVYQ